MNQWPQSVDKPVESCHNKAAKLKDQLIPEGFFDFPVTRHFSRAHLAMGHDPFFPHHGERQNK
jgi:hypothetical protein